MARPLATDHSGGPWTFRGATPVHGPDPILSRAVGRIPFLTRGVFWQNGAPECPHEHGVSSRDAWPMAEPVWLAQDPRFRLPSRADCHARPGGGLSGRCYRAGSPRIPRAWAARGGGRLTAARLLHRRGQPDGAPR